MIVDRTRLSFLAFAALFLAAPGCGSQEAPPKQATAHQADDYSCARFMAFDPSQCDAEHCAANGCAALYAECAASGGLSNFGHTLEGPDGDICNCTTACTTNMVPEPPPPPPCVPTCNNNCGGGDGCGGTCPILNDYCASCGMWSRCATYYCGDCPPAPVDLCAGDGCDVSCCSVDSSSTYWCCGG